MSGTPNASQPPVVLRLRLDYLFITSALATFPSLVGGRWLPLKHGNMCYHFDAVSWSILQA